MTGWRTASAPGRAAGRRHTTQAASGTGSLSLPVSAHGHWAQLEAVGVRPDSESLALRVRLLPAASHGGSVTRIAASVTADSPDTRSPSRTLLLKVSDMGYLVVLTASVLRCHFTFKLVSLLY